MYFTSTHYISCCLVVFVSLFYVPVYVSDLYYRLHFQTYYFSLKRNKGLLLNCLCNSVLHTVGMQYYPLFLVNHPDWSTSWNQEEGRTRILTRTTVLEQFPVQSCPFSVLSVQRYQKSLFVCTREAAGTLSSNFRPKHLQLSCNTFLSAPWQFQIPHYPHSLSTPIIITSHRPFRTAYGNFRFRVITCEST